MATGGAPAGSPLSRGLVIVAWLGCATLAVAGIKAASSIVAPVFLALVLTVTVHPVRRLVLRRGWPGWSGTVIALVTVYLLLIAMVAALVFAGARLAGLLPLYQDEFADMLASAAENLKALGVGQDQIDAMTSGLDLGRLAQVVGRVVGATFSLLSDLTLIVTLLLFFGMDASVLPRILEKLRGERPALVGGLESFGHGTRRYFVVSTIFGVIVATFDTLFLALTPVPAPILWGVLAFITNYIPNIGFVIGLVPPAVLGLLEGGPGLMLLIIAVYCLVNFVIQSVIQPRYVGEAVGLSPSVTMVSLIFWTWVVGPLGALLAVPLTLLAKALLVDADPGSVWLRPLLTGSSADEVPNAELVPPAARAVAAADHPPGVRRRIRGGSRLDDR
jgi:predicted PurR-regulated permease PerM